MSTQAIAVSGERFGSGIAADSDHALVSAVRGGCDRAFEELYERYRRRIHAYIYGMVSDHGRAEDVTQEVFISALRRMQATDRPIAFKPWIYEIARNACIDSYRRTTTRAEEVSYDHDAGLAPADSRRLVAVGAGPDDAVESKQKLDMLCGAFTGLSEAHHEILVLRELDGLSYREIGERMGLSRPAVESSLFRARKRLSAEYEELVSGRRCERVQAIVTAAAENALGARDRERLARHVSYCQPCRRHAYAMGLPDLAPQKRTVRGRLAAVIPLPALRRGGSHEAGAASQAAQPGAWVTQLSAGLGATIEPLNAGWTKIAAAVVAIAAGGMGAGMATHGHPLAVLHKAVALVAPAPERSAPPAPSALSFGGGRVFEPGAAGSGARGAEPTNRAPGRGDAASGGGDLPNAPGGDLPAVPKVAADRLPAFAAAPDAPGVPAAPGLPGVSAPDAPRADAPPVEAPNAPDAQHAPAAPSLPDAPAVPSAPAPPQTPPVTVPPVPSAGSATGDHPVRDTVSAVKAQAKSVLPAR